MAVYWWQILTMCFCFVQCFREPVVITADVVQTLHLTVYYESLCEGCHEFILQQLIPTWKNVTSYLNIDLVPYGNADRTLVDGKWVYTCQHGPIECQGNLAQACVVKLYQRHKPEKVLDFIKCYIEENSTEVDKVTEKCALQTDISLENIKNCTTGEDGQKIILYFAKRTEIVRKVAPWVPLVQINGDLHLKEQNSFLSDLLKAVCKYITGTKPDVCKHI